jgi:hypothetical protein
LGSFVACGDIRNGFSVFNMEENRTTKKVSLKEYFDESMKVPCFSVELAFFEDSLRVISSDGQSNILIHKILQTEKNPNGILKKRKF